MEWEEAEETPKSGKDLFKKYFWTIFIVAYLFLYYRNSTVAWNTFITYSILLFILIYIGEMTWVGLKHATPKLIFNPGFSTTIGEGRDVGNYTLFTLGDMRAGSFEWAGSDGTVIVPKTGTTKVGRSVVVRVRVMPRKVDRIPPNVAEVLLTQNPKGGKGSYPEPYYIGYADEGQYLKKWDEEVVIGEITLNKPSVEYLISELESRNKEVNAQRLLSARALEAIESYASSVGRIGEKEKSLVKQVLEALSREKEEKEK